jgi:hypothetical protein
MVVAMAASSSEANSGLAALVWLALGLTLLVLFGSLAYVIGRDANRRGRNGLAWGLLFIWQPVIVGIIYLFVRRKKRVDRAMTN